jgi:hypothetical protein
LGTWIPAPRSAPASLSGTLFYTSKASCSLEQERLEPAPFHAGRQQALLPIRPQVSLILSSSLDSPAPLTLGPSNKTQARQERPQIT